MDTQTLHILFLKKYIFSFSTKNYETILDKYKTLECGYVDKYQQLAESKFKNHLLKTITKYSINDIYKDIEICKRNNIKILTFLDSKFPSILLQANPQPLVLFYQGNIDLLTNINKNIAIIGARKISPYSQKVLDDIATKIKGLNIISGLAYGVDSYSQRIAVETDIPTIGVIGGGLMDKVFYPNQNIPLKNKIIEKKGLIISQFFPDQVCLPFHFPIRNQIVVLLSSLVWVVQAKINSGSSITAGLALDFGVDLATTPANIYDENFDGNLKILKNGCHIITDINDINGFFNLNKVEKKSQMELFGDQKIIADQLITEDYSIDELESKIGDLIQSDLFSLISQMELDGKIKCIKGDRYILSLDAGIN